MAFTRFHDDPCRVAKQLQQSTDVGRWILNVPGNGDKPQYMADPQIRIQGWGANLMTNCINLESELKGVNRPLNKDCLGVDNYTCAKYQVNSKPVIKALAAYLKTWQLRKAHPKLPFSAIYDILQGEDVDIEEASKPIRNRRKTSKIANNKGSVKQTQLAYRNHKFAIEIIENVGKGIFPLFNQKRASRAIKRSV